MPTCRNCQQRIGLFSTIWMSTIFGKGNYFALCKPCLGSLTAEGQELANDCAMKIITETLESLVPGQAISSAGIGHWRTLAQLAGNLVGTALVGGILAENKNDFGILATTHEELIIVRMGQAEIASLNVFTIPRYRTEPIVNRFSLSKVRASVANKGTGKVLTLSGDVKLAATFPFLFSSKNMAQADAIASAVASAKGLG